MLLNLLGGIFARNDAKKTEARAREAQAHSDFENRHYLAESLTDNRRVADLMLKIPQVTTGNLDSLVAASESSGFNPLSVLRAGGLSAFTTTTGHNAAAWGELSRSIPWQGSPMPVHHIPSMGSVFVKAAQDTVSDIAGAMSSGALSGRVPAMAVTNGSMLTSGLTYAQTALGGNRSGSAFQQAGGLSGAVGSRLSAPTVTGDRTNTPPTRWFDNDPDSTDVGVGEEAAGDIGGTAFFPLWLSDQIYYNATGLRGSVRDTIAASAFQLVAQQYKSIYGGMVGAMQQKPSLSRVDRILANPNLSFGEPLDLPPRQMGGW